MTSVVENVSKKAECNESMETVDTVKKSSTKKKDPTPAETAARQKKQQAEKEKNHKQQQQSQPRRNRNKKQNGSWKKLDVDINFNKPNRGSHSGNGKRRGGKNNNRAGEKGKGRGAKQRSNNKYSHNKSHKGVRYNYNDGCQHYHPELHLQDALRQIEYFFSTQELSRNPYIRAHMDSNGYVPAAIIFNFPSVANYGIPYHHLLNVIHTSSQSLIVDSHNQTLRLKKDWQRWLFPNPDGTFGCDPWIISTEQQQQQQQYTPQDTTDTKDTTETHSEQNDDNADDNDSSNNSSASTHPCTDSDAEST